MIYYYGGTFDPITRAHVDIIKNINKHLTADDEFYVGIVNNDEKLYNISYKLREEITKETINSVFNKNNIKYVKQYTRTYAFLKEQFKDKPVTIIVGQDEWESLVDNKWIESKALLNNYNFILVKRKNIKNYEEIDIQTLKKYKNRISNIITIDNSNNISSTAIRDIFYRNPMTIYADVKFGIHKMTFELIKENKLYKHNNLNYKAEEEAFIKQYKIDKQKNGWPEPSVTVDILAYNGNQVLLIRRGNFPYKWHFCLPGGFFDLSDEDLNHTAAREFREETTIDIAPEKFKQIKTYSHIFDPRLRIIDVAFAVRVNAKDMKKAIGSDDAIEAKWFDINDLPPLGFHHRQIIDDWLFPNSNN